MKLLLSLFPLLFASWVNAATINAASTSRANVLTAIQSAMSGDTVNIPAGTSAWTPAIPVTNAITINGNGTNSTIIQNGQSATTGYDKALFSIQLKAAEINKVLTFQNIKFVATTAPSEPGGSGGVIAITSDGAATFPTKVRITACHFEQFNFAMVPYWFGVCDHCTFYNVKNASRWPCISAADLPGTPPYAWNSANWFFAEDCIFTQDGGGVWYIQMDSEGPSLQAVRYSTYNISGTSYYQLFDMHGNGNCGSFNGAGILSYRNTINSSGVADVQLVDIRGGSGSLCYSNTCTGSAYTTIRTDPAGSDAPANTYVWGNVDSGGPMGGSAPGSFSEYVYPHPLVTSGPAAPTRLVVIGLGIFR